MRRLLSLGPPNNAIKETYKSGLDRYPPNPTSPKGVWGFVLPPGEDAMRGGGGVQLGACVGAVCGGAASGCAGFDALYEEEIMQPLDSVYV
jgi:hypothetical protein